MPGASYLSTGNIPLSTTLYASLTPAASVTAATSTTSTYTINGLLQYDCVDIYPQAALTALLTIGSVWVSAANTLSVQWINSSASNSTAAPTAISCEVLISRSAFSSYPFNSSNWPTALE